VSYQNVKTLRNELPFPGNVGSAVALKSPIEKTRLPRTAVNFQAFDFNRRILQINDTGPQSAFGLPAVEFEKPVMISGDKYFILMRQAGKPAIEGANFFGRAAGGGIAGMDQNIAVRNGYFFVAVMRVAETDDLWHRLKTLATKSARKKPGNVFKQLYSDLQGLKIQTPITNMARIKIFVILLFIGSVFFCAAQTSAQCNTEASKLGALVKIGEDDGKKTPLILIHGYGGVAAQGDIAILDDYWGSFIENFWKKDPALQAKYALYAFQYCSDHVDVSAIAAEFRDRIDAELTDRDHVLLAHSMGGLVATAYMAETAHNSGEWKNKTGGDTTIGLITLATPHHGTPGANSPQTVEKYVPLLYKFFYPRANRLFWESTLGKDHPAVSDSGLPNRSDLRWDNYDQKFALPSESVAKDLNTKLFQRNSLFKKYDGKLIAYAGHVESVFSGINALEVLDDLLRSGNIMSRENKHRVLDMANYFFTNGLDNNFQITDGLVPFDSGLFCGPSQNKNARLPKNFICASAVKARRFEAGAKEGLVARSDYPDKNTLSIFRAKNGFDHLDMLENKDVLGFVVSDLKSFKTAKAQPAAANKLKK
jgi:pimeloyl-ACP methyl ester carboxylesterase